MSTGQMLHRIYMCHAQQKSEQMNINHVFMFCHFLKDTYEKSVNSEYTVGAWVEKIYPLRRRMKKRRVEVKLLFNELYKRSELTEIVQPLCMRIGIQGVIKSFLNKFHNGIDCFYREVKAGVGGRHITPSFSYLTHKN